MIDLHYIREKFWLKGYDYTLGETADWIEKHCPQAETTEEVLHFIPISTIVDIPSC